MEWLLGSLGFALFLVNDLNDVKFHKGWMKTLFLVGCFSVLFSTVLAVKADIGAGALLKVSSVVSMVIAGICLGLLIYTLFFALPFADSYVENTGNHADSYVKNEGKHESKRNVCDIGMYAICRHPGVIWFFLFYLFSGIALQKGALLGVGMMMSGWNLMYVVFQDYYTFPKMFSDYENYKEYTPFLIPNRRSILRGMKTWQKRGDKG